MKETDLNYESFQWFLDFLTLDLHTINTRKLTHFTQWYFLGQWPYFPQVKVKDYYELDEDEVRKEAKAKGYNESFDTKWPGKEILMGIQEDLRKIVDALIEGGPVMYKVVAGDLLFVAGAKGFSFGYELQLPRKRDYDLETSKLIARIALYRLLDGLPRYIIGKCRECGKYFIKLKDRAKFFCRQKCASDYSHRKARNENPKAYRAKQREIMRRKYAEKKAKKLGISVEEALKTYEDKEK